MHQQTGLVALPPACGADWWTDKMPREIFDEVVTGSDSAEKTKLRRDLLFNASQVVIVNNIEAVSPGMNVLKIKT